MANGRKAKFWQVLYLMHHSEEGTAGEHSLYLGISDGYVRTICHLLNLDLKSFRRAKFKQVQFKIPVRGLRLTQEIPTTRLFCSNIVRLREFRKLSQQQMARHLGVSVERYSAWEENVCFPPAKFLIQICDLLEYRNIYKLITMTIDVRKIDVLRRERIIG